MNVDAHVKEVAKVRFNCDGSYMISIGKHDRAIMLWQVLPMPSTAPSSSNTALVPASNSVI